jgi:nitrate/nitrite-specific signal transduction histidine kinase
MDRRGFMTMAGAGCTLLAFDVSAAPATPAVLSLPSAINKAGRQRMLSQRTAKAWLMLVLGIVPDKAKSLLTQSVSLFEQQLGELRSAQPNDEIKAAFRQLEQEWSRYRPLLADIRSDAKAVWAGSDAVLAAAQRLVQAYEKTAGTAASRLISLSGRQRMLSQRMAKAYFFRQMGINPAQAGEMLDAAAKEFGKAHDELKAAPRNSAHIKEELALVEQQWFFFQNALSLGDAGDQKRAAANVATTSERILEQMDEVVGLYEKSARDVEY